MVAKTASIAEIIGVDKLNFLCRTSGHGDPKSGSASAPPLRSCVKFESGHQEPSTAYRETVRSNGTPSILHVEGGEFTAIWPDLTFNVTGNPNLIRTWSGTQDYTSGLDAAKILRYVSSYSDNNDITSEQVADNIEQDLCITHAELDRLSGYHVRDTGDVVSEELACGGKTAEMCDAIKDLAKATGRNPVDFTLESKNYGYSAEAVEEIHRLWLSTGEARAAELVICHETGHCGAN